MEGTGYEIYRKKIEEIDFSNVLSFKDVSRIAHQFFNTIVFALEIQLKDKSYDELKPVIKINPVNFELVDWQYFNFYLYIICADEEDAKKVQKLEMPNDKYERYVGVPRRQHPLTKNLA